MLALAALLLLALPQDPPAPDPERIDAAVRELRAAFAGKETEPKVDAVKKAREVVDAAVIDALAKGLKEERPVQEAVLEALRWTDHPAALEALHAAYRRDRKLAEDEELFAVLLKSIGQHASSASIGILAEHPFARPDHAAIQARILGLGRIRDPRSVSELIGMMQAVGRAKSAPYMADFRLALGALTGVDRGKTVEAWIAWWNDHKKDYEVPEEMPPLPEASQRRWNRYWGLDYEVGRKEKREDRGGDGG